MSTRDILTWAALGSIAILIALIAYRVVVPSEETLHARKISAALFQCQQRIVGLAEYGDAETPPYVANYGTKGEFYFAWQRGSFHFKNGYGAPEKMSASCIGDLETGEIKQLTVNAKTIL
ncbi:hypothetical protein [Massilia brevitalea]|uniref:hypothetical protein n=1 Tax=Massilia brevitalea TaxID=442526 RepID=UPI0027399044|nr:hypothetical protein [Massilia brevitalea]